MVRKKAPIPDIPVDFLNQASSIIDKEGVPKGREPREYVVIVNGKSYPHKHLIAVAHRLWKGRELPVSRFVGGWDQTIPFLTKKGFEIRTLSGEPISLDRFVKNGKDFAPVLREYLQREYRIKIAKGKGRAHLAFPSGNILHVRGSKELKSGAFYYLQQEDYDGVVKKPNHYFAAVYGKPEKTFVMSEATLKKIFDGKPLTRQRNKKPKWYFDIREKESRYELRLHHPGAESHDITESLNRWDLISDLKNTMQGASNREISDSSQFFLVQVSEQGSSNLLKERPVYEHYGWQETPRDADHGKVRPDDILVVYFARKAINHAMLLKKIYKVDSVSANNEMFHVSEVDELPDITLDEIRKAIEAGKLSAKFEKLGQQGFNITQISKQDFDSIMALRGKSNLDFKNERLFITSCNQENLLVCKEKGVVGWKNDSKSLRPGDIVFEYNTNTSQFECGFRIKARLTDNKPLWPDEKRLNPAKVIYPYRWDAELLCDNLGIDRDTLKITEPFKSYEDKRRLGILLMGNSPKSINEEKYADLRNLLQARCHKTTAGRNSGLTLDGLCAATLFPREEIQQIQALLDEKKQMIFYGPPGTGKTFFARLFSYYYTQKQENVIVVQFHPSYNYEDFIEGIRPKTSDEEKTVTFVKQPGIFRRIVEDCKKSPNEKFVLIIDEINRGNIAKIFGELIYLLEYRDEKVFLTYSPDEEFSIPSNLYLIGTMNSADRSIAYIDYALRRRFYFRGFYPDYDILAKWFESYPPSISKEYPRKIIDTLKQVNEAITEKFGIEYQIGHSFFMARNLDESRLKRILDYSVKPLLEQYFYGKKEDVEDLIEACMEMLPAKT